MNTKPTKRSIRGGQDGYAMMIVLFFLAVLTVSLLTIVVPAMTDNQREKEAELVWRGKQYVRGIRLYYQKMHRFPTDLEDLYKPKTGIRFMREAYKDPMNTVDGSWRLIYVGPNGQLIGSLKNRNLGGNQTAQGNAAGVGGSSLNSTSFGSSSFGNSSFGNSSFGSSQGGAQNNSQNGSSFGNSSFGNSSFGNSNNNSSFGNSNNNSSFGNSSFGNNNSNANNNGAANGQDQQNPNGDNANPDSFGVMGSPQSLQTADLPTTVIGGNIIGVGSKINKKSFLWYDKAKNYRLFEFVWDPSTDSITGQQAGTVPVNNAPLGPGATAPGNSSFGNSSFGNNSNSSFGNNSNSSFGNNSSFGSGNSNNNNNSNSGQSPNSNGNSGQGLPGTNSTNDPNAPPLQAPPG
jgi:hypothetical protein